MEYDYEIRGYIVKFKYEGKIDQKRFDDEKIAVNYAKHKIQFCAADSVQVIQERNVIWW